MRDHLISEDPASEEILKPILRGRDIARYHANWAGLWLIDTHNGYEDVPAINVDEYPAIKGHLEKYIERLERRQDKGITPYNLRNCAYHEEFRKPKLFWMHMSPEGRFALGEPNIACNQKCFMVTGENLHYLCAILNSTLVTWLVRRIAVTTGMGLPQWDKFTVERVPVARPDRSITNGFRDLVKSMLAAIDAGDTQEITRVQKTIDSCVYELYDLKPEESKSVSRQVNG